MLLDEGTDVLVRVPRFTGSLQGLVNLLTDLLPYAVFISIIACLFLYFVGAEEGATHIFPGMTLHEWVHDGRHLLGFPCH